MHMYWHTLLLASVPVDAQMYVICSCICIYVYTYYYSPQCIVYTLERNHLP